MAKRLLWLLLCILPIYSSYTVAASWQIKFDNDILLGTDGDYSNGLYIKRAEAMSISQVSPIVYGQAVLLPGGRERLHQWSLEQRLWTPEEIMLHEAQPDDRPYAATLAIRSLMTAYHQQFSTSNWLEVGVLGPAALGETAQHHVHLWTDSSNPNGWDHQIKNTLLFNVGMEFDIPVIIHPQFALSLQAGAQFGTTIQSLTGGATLLWGSEVEIGSVSAIHGIRNFIERPAIRHFIYAGAYQWYVQEDKTITGSLDYRSNVDLNQNQSRIQVGWFGQYHLFGLSIAANYGDVAFSPAPTSRNGYASISIMWKY